MSVSRIWFFRLNLDNPYGFESYVLALLLAILVSVVSYPFVNMIDIANIVMLFLLEVFLCALWLGQGPSLFAAVASVSLFDFFFVPPQFAFLTTSVEHIVTLVVMLLVALLTGQMASTLLAQNRELYDNEQLTNSLYCMARELAGAVDVQQMNEIAARYPTIPATDSLLGIARERLHFADMAQQHLVQVESERLRASILSSLSHDLRTPLTALVGLTETLMLRNERIPVRIQQDMLIAVHEQSVRLAQMVSNLLDLARLSSGKVRINKEWQSLDDLLGAALNLLKSLLLQRQVHVQINIPSDFPLLACDAVLMERVIGNLLENAIKHAPVDSSIFVTARTQGEYADICIADQGQGFPPHLLSASGFVGGDHTQTTGLGLAICDAILKAHNGHLHLLPGDGGGACAGFTLPLGTPPKLMDDEFEEELS